MGKIPLSARNQDDNSDPLVSILCYTYNHGQFIRQCLDGFLKQETSFPVEIVVHDDASSDGTTDILRSYDDRLPGLFRNIYNPVNLWPDIPHAVQMVNRFCRGKYIAFCEGDDRWTDPEKLQIQVDLLESRPDVAGCFHQSRLIDEDGVVFEESYFTPRKPLLSLRDCLEGSLSSYASCAFVFRRSAVSNPPPWLELRCNDMFLELGVALSGDIFFIDRSMSDYRKHPGGAWTSMPETSQMVELCVRLEILLMYEPFRSEFAAILRRRIQEHLDWIGLGAGNSRQVIKQREEYLSILEEVGSERLKYIEDLEKVANERLDLINAMDLQLKAAVSRAGQLSGRIESVRNRLIFRIFETLGGGKI